MKRILIMMLAAALCAACGKMPQGNIKKDVVPTIYPDYTGVTIPVNIAPLNFKIAGDGVVVAAKYEYPGGEMVIRAHHGQIQVPITKWRKMLRQAVGGTIHVSVVSNVDGETVSYAPFDIEVSEDEIDPYIAYRLIDPGYEMWNFLGIYQRNLENFDQTSIITNRQTDRNCMNCHSFCSRDPQTLMFHMREAHSCTVVIKDGKIETLNTKTPQTFGSFAYPSWHPSGKYIAFSINDVAQTFHSYDRNRVEVFDFRSDVLVYDVENHVALTCDAIFSEENFESLPSFSADGKTLYFCTSSAKEEMPTECEDLRYSLCAISFDASTGRFGSQVDTLFNAQQFGKSLTYPRESPDGKHLLFTLSSYGYFDIWHKDADLYMMDLSQRSIRPLEKANSNDVESFHNWSGNSRWIVFSSRRDDGLYTRPYFAHVDQNGEESKAFMLPQKDVDYYVMSLKSYNLPEFVSGKVTTSSYRIARKVKNAPELNVSLKREITQ